MQHLPRQRVRYLRTADGVQLAWAEAGEGPLLVKAANWLTHLEFEWQSPVWRHWIQFFCEHFRFIRYDERGCGMTDWRVGDLSFERWVDDLEQVVEAVSPKQPFPLLGVSQGAAVCLSYAVRHPERVSRLILYGGYAQGSMRRGDPEAAREFNAIIELVRVGWTKDNPAFREVFTSRFMPGASDEQIAWFNDLCRRTTSPDVAAELLRVRSQVDVVDLLDKVRAPTLIVHANRDEVVPIAQGRMLAARIPQAQYVEVDSRNHVLLEHEPAWERFREAVLAFMELPEASEKEDEAFVALSVREREILGLITEGLSNAQIAERLSISEKTVRNHISNIFDKLGVWTRAQAIVFARDRGFQRSAFNVP